MRCPPRTLTSAAVALRPFYLQRRLASNRPPQRPPPPPPPPSRPFKASPPRTTPSRPPAPVEQTPSQGETASSPGTPAATTTTTTSTAAAATSSAAAQQAPPDPQRGLEASQRFAQDFIVDARYKDSPRYKSTAARVQAVYVALPILIVTSYFLWKRLAYGEEQKRVPVPEAAGRDG